MIVEVVFISFNLKLIKLRYMEDINKQIEENAVEYAVSGERGAHTLDARRLCFVAGANFMKDKLYTEEEVYNLIKLQTERLTNSWVSSDIEWFEQNKKK